MALLWFKWLTGFLIYAHPFFVSVTEINHNATEKTLEISCKVFADDMEDILKKNYQVKVDLTDPKKVDDNNKLIEAYVRKNLSIVVDGKAVPLHYLGFEKEKESIYVYVEGNNVAAVKKLDLTISLLQDLNDEQINIMHVSVHGERKSTKLDHPKKQASFSF
jgi:hypothetical protein